MDELQASSPDSPAIRSAGYSFGDPRDRVSLRIARDLRRERLHHRRKVKGEKEATQHSRQRRHQKLEITARLELKSLASVCVNAHNNPREVAMPGWLLIVLIIAAYVVLTQWVLPKFGVSA